MEKHSIFKKRFLGVMLAFAFIFLFVPNSASAGKKVKLNKTKVNLNVGKTVSLKLKYNKKKVKWSSSNKKVANVNKKGKVKAKNKGKATITAKVGKKKYKCKIIVRALAKKTNTVLVKQIKMQNSELTFQVGETRTIGITISPNNATNKSVKWRSEDSGIASVDQSGMVKGISQGTTAIWAEKDDAYGYGKACCFITVTKTNTSNETPKPNETSKPTKTPSGKLNNTSQKIDLTQTCQLFLSGAKVHHWTSSDNSIATVENGLVTPLKTGSVVIKCEDTEGFEYSCDINIIYPDIKFEHKNIRTTTLNNTNYYSLDFIISNNCNYDIIFGGKEPFTDKEITCVMYYQNGFGDKSTAAFGLSKSSSPINFVNEINATVACEKNKSTAIYAFEGNTKYVPDLSCNFMWTVTINNIKYSVLTDYYGQIIAMTSWGVSDVQYVKLNSISLDKTDITMELGNTEKITASILPENASDKFISFSSNDESIASVIGSDNVGTITANSLGTTTITIKCGEIETTCMVKVIPVEVTDIILDKEDITMTIGKTEKITASILPINASDKSISFSSNDESIASIISGGNVGTITANSLGTTTITIKCGEVEVACTVKVISQQDMSMINFEKLDSYIQDNGPITGTVLNYDTYCMNNAGGWENKGKKNYTIKIHHFKDVERPYYYFAMECDAKYVQMYMYIYDDSPYEAICKYNCIPGKTFEGVISDTTSYNASSIVFSKNTSIDNNILDAIKYWDKLLYRETSMHLRDLNFWNM